jgi:hypothetical protein
MVILLMFLFGCVRDKTNPDADDLPSNDILAAGEITQGKFAEVVRTIGGGHIQADSKRAAVEGLTAYLDGIGQVAATGSEDDFTRAEVVAFAQEVGDSANAVNNLADSVITWGTSRLELLVSDEEFDETDVETVLFPLAAVIAAMSNGVDEADNDTTGGDFTLTVVEQLTFKLGMLIAEDQDVMMPDIPPEGERDEVDLSDPWPEELAALIESASPNFDNPIADYLRPEVRRQLNGYDDPDSDDWMVP